MAQFPKIESEIIALAQAVLRGLKARPDVFPTPPIDLEQFEGKLNDHSTLEQQWNTLQTQSVLMTAQKKTSTEAIAADLHNYLRYAEIVVQDEAQLGIIGWSGRAARTPLEAPGQCRMLEASVQGNDSIHFSWKAPAEGGKPSAYEIQRHELPNDVWVSAGTAVDTEKTITGQPTGKKLEFRVFAVNKAGDGPVSNVVVVAL